MTDSEKKKPKPSQAQLRFVAVLQKAMNEIKKSRVQKSPKKKELKK